MPTRRIGRSTVVLILDQIEGGSAERRLCGSMATLPYPGETRDMGGQTRGSGGMDGNAREDPVRAELGHRSGRVQYDAGLGFAGVLASAGLLRPLDHLYASGALYAVLPWTKERMTFDGVGNQFDAVAVYYHADLF